MRAPAIAMPPYVIQIHVARDRRVEALIFECEECNYVTHTSIGKTGSFSMLWWDEIAGHIRSHAET
jgi:hypothetical protein